MSELLREVDLNCGLTNDHVVKEPISSIETDKSKLEINTESVLDKTIIKSSLSGLFEELEKRATNEIKSFKS